MVSGLVRHLIQAPTPGPQWEVNANTYEKDLLPEGKGRCRWIPESFVPFPLARAPTLYGHEAGARSTPCRAILMHTWLVPSQATYLQLGWPNTIASGALSVALVSLVDLGSTPLADLKPAQPWPGTCTTLSQEQIASLPSSRSMAATLQLSDESRTLPDTRGAKPSPVPWRSHTTTTQRRHGSNCSCCPKQSWMRHRAGAKNITRLWRPTHWTAWPDGTKGSGWLCGPAGTLHPNLGARAVLRNSGGNLPQG